MAEAKDKAISRMEDEEFLRWAHGELYESMQRLSTWRKSASTNFDFYAGEQWKDAVYEYTSEDDETQLVTFNRVARTVNAIAGIEMQNRRQIKFYPREIGDAAVSDKMTDSAKWVRDGTEAEHEESEAFLDMLICGMGFDHYRLDADMAEPRIMIERVDPLECLWDARARKKNLTDTKWRARLKSLSTEELLERWPDADLGMASKGQKYLDYPTKPHDSTPPRYEERNDEGQQNNESGFEVIEFEYWEYEDYYQLQTEQGTLVEFTPEKWRHVREYAEQRGLPHAKRKRKKYRIAYFSGMEMLQEEDSITQTDFVLQAITGLRNRNENTWFGLVDLMRDPQRWANKWLSQILHTVNANAKGGLLAETDAFEDVRQAEDSWAFSDSITWLRPGGLSKIQEKSYGQVPAGVDRMLQYALEAIGQTSGVNVEMLGLANQDQPGVVEESRKRAGITIVAMFFDAQRLYYKRAGRMLMELIREYIADGRLVRMLGERGAQYVPLIKDEMAVEYDVIVDDAPDSPDVRDKTFGALMQVIPLVMQAGIPIPPEVLEYAPFPDDLIQKWKERLQPQEPDPEQQMDKQIARDSQMAMVEEMRSKAMLNQSTAKTRELELTIKEQELQLRALQSKFDAQMEQLKHANEMEVKRTDADQEAKRLEMEATQRGFDAQMRKQEQEFNEKMALLKHQQEMEVNRVKNLSTLEAIEERDGIRIREMQDSVAKNAEAITKMLEAMTKLKDQVSRPRKRTLVRDKEGRATHAIEVFMADDDMGEMH